jgi:hypothetical protein
MAWEGPTLLNPRSRTCLALQQSRGEGCWPARWLENARTSIMRVSPGSRTITGATKSVDEAESDVTARGSVYRVGVPWWCRTCHPPSVGDPSPNTHAQCPRQERSAPWSLRLCGRRSASAAHHLDKAIGGGTVLPEADDTAVSPHAGPYVGRSIRANDPSLHETRRNGWSTLVCERYRSVFVRSLTNVRMALVTNGDMNVERDGGPF